MRRFTRPTHRPRHAASGVFTWSKPVRPHKRAEVVSPEKAGASSRAAPGCSGVSSAIYKWSHNAIRLATFSLWAFNFLMKKENHGAYLHVGRPQLGIPAPAGKRPVWITGYDESDDFVCRLEISAERIAVYSGTKGRKKHGQWTWKEFIAMLATIKQPKNNKISN